jgi:cytoskeletal protein RodZ
MIRIIIIVFDPFSTGTGSAALGSTTDASTLTLVSGTGSTFVVSLTYSSDLVTDTSASGSATGSATGSAAGSATGSTTGSATGSAAGSAAGSSYKFINPYA